MHKLDPASIKIKVCGMRESANIRELSTLNPDYMGFIFYAPSKRFAEELDTLALDALPAGTKRTGVFVNASEEEILIKAGQYKLDALQLHGNESAEFCQKLKTTGLEIIKAFGVDEDFDFAVLNTYEGVADFFLFDTKTRLHGGSGLTFDWSLLNGYTLNTPYFLSGGLDQENIFQALQINDKRFYALDLNSKFELEPGLKDIQKLKTVIDKIKGIPA